MLGIGFARHIFFFFKYFVRIVVEYESRPSKKNRTRLAGNAIRCGMSPFVKQILSRFYSKNYLRSLSILFPIDERAGADVVIINS